MTIQVAKKSSRSRKPSQKPQARRVQLSVATRRVLGRPLTTRFGPRDRIPADRRIFTPPSSPRLKNNRRLTATTYRTPTIKQNKYSRLATPGRHKNSKKELFSITYPKFSPLCARRHIRKRIMHARGAAGSKVKLPIRNLFSNISCKG